MLFKTPHLNEYERKITEEILSIRDNLRYAISSSYRWVGVLRRNTFARAIQGSNSIEGYNVTADDAIAAVEGEEPLDAASETWAAIMGYRGAMTYVLQLSNDPHFVYSDGLIRSLHFMMLGYDLNKHPGRWRPAGGSAPCSAASVLPSAGRWRDRRSGRGSGRCRSTRSR